MSIRTHVEHVYWTVSPPRVQWSVQVRLRTALLGGTYAVYGNWACSYYLTRREAEAVYRSIARDGAVALRTGTIQLRLVKLVPEP